ncbi:MAG TPA: MoaD/ThiS family protein, partial [Acidimicrobiia bacterium]|nr:MoaD/ThiS family protein [Acidimicrobiia bacterium]
MIVSVTVRIPTQLRELSGGSSEVQVEGKTVAEVLEALEERHPGFSERLHDENG